jgi:hypothetical protein
LNIAKVFSLNIDAEGIEGLEAYVFFNGHALLEVQRIK